MTNVTFTASLNRGYVPANDSSGGALNVTLGESQPPTSSPDPRDESGCSLVDAGSAVPAYDRHALDLLRRLDFSARSIERYRLRASFIRFHRCPAGWSDDEHGVPRPILRLQNRVMRAYVQRRIDAIRTRTPVPGVQPGQPYAGISRIDRFSIDALELAQEALFCDVEKGYRTLFRRRYRQPGDLETFVELDLVLRNQHLLRFDTIAEHPASAVLRECLAR